jgi:hypothetical protein
MSRSVSWVGLNARAEELLKERATGKPEMYDVWKGPWGEGYQLFRYPTSSGFLEEAVQSGVWFSGPVVFLALKDETGMWVKKTLWKEKEKEKYQ